MDFQMIIDAISGQGIWCLLFIWLFFTSRKESIERENKLTSIINAHGEQLKEMTQALDRINGKIEKLSGDK
jgi:hypothetical protein